MLRGLNHAKTPVSSLWTSPSMRLAIGWVMHPEIA